MAVAKLLNVRQALCQAASGFRHDKHSELNRMDRMDEDVYPQGAVGQTRQELPEDPRGALLGGSRTALGWLILTQLQMQPVASD